MAYRVVDNGSRLGSSFAWHFASDWVCAKKTPEQQDVGLPEVDFVVLPASTLHDT